MRNLLAFIFVGILLFLGCQRNIYTEDDEVAVLRVGPATIEFSIPLKAIIVHNESGEGIGVRCEKEIMSNFSRLFEVHIGGRGYHLYSIYLTLGDKFLIRVWQGDDVWTTIVVLRDGGPQILSSSPGTRIEYIPRPGAPSGPAEK